MRIFYPSKWTIQQIIDYEHSRNIHPMKFTLKGYYPNGIKDTDFCDIVWSFVYFSQV